MISDSDQKLLDEVLEGYTASRDNLVQVKNNDWNRFYKLYCSKLDKSKYPLRSKIFLPYIYQTIETQVPVIISAIFKSFPVVRIRPTKSTDILSAKNIQNKISHQMMSIPQLIYRMSMFIKSFLIYGTVYAKIPWEVKTHKVYDTVPEKVIMDTPIGEKRVPRDETIYDGPNFYPLNPWEVFPDPGAREFMDCYYVIHRAIVSEDFMKTQADKGNYRLSEDLLKENVDPYSFDDFDTTRKGYRGDHFGKLTPERFKEYEILEYWKSGELIVICNRKYVVQHATLKDNTFPYENGQNPFIQVKNNPILGEQFGRSEVEQLEMLQYELNDMTNIGMDNAALLGSLMLLCDRAAKIGDIIIQPGGRINYTEKPPVPIQWPNILQNTQGMKESIKFEMQTTSGVSDIMKGQRVPVVSETATGVQTLTANAMSRIDLKIRILQSMAIEELAKKFHELNKQFAPDSEEMNIGGSIMDKFTNIPNTDYQKEYLFQYVGAFGYGDPNLRRQEKLALFDRFARAFAPGIFKGDEYGKSIMRDDFDIEDADSYWNAPPPPMGPPMPPGIAGNLPPGSSPMMDPNQVNGSQTSNDDRAPTSANMVNMIQGLMTQGGGG